MLLSWTLVSYPLSCACWWCRSFRGLTAQQVFSWDTWACVMLMCWSRRKSWGFPLLELAWCIPDLPGWFCWFSKWRTVCCFVKLAFFAKFVSKINSLRGRWMPETCCNGSSVSAPRKLGTRRNVADCFDWQWVNRCWEFFTQLFSEACFNSYPAHFLKVKRWTRYLGFEICLFWYSLLFLSGIILTPQLCKQFLGLCVINLKTAQS